MKLSCREILLTVDKKDVHIICTFLEGCENCASIRTPQPKKGLSTTTLQLMVSPYYLSEIKTAINQLKKKGIKIAASFT